MVLLGIDPGSNITGYAFLQKDADGQVIRVLEFGAIKAKASEELMERLGGICAELEERIRIHKPTKLAMEASFFAKNAKTAMVLGHARGAVMTLAFRYGMSFAELSPRSIKQMVTGSGAASKERVASMMKLHLGLKSLPEPIDASDALAVAWCLLSPSPLQNAITKQVRTHATKKAPITYNTSEESTRRVANAIPEGTDIQALLAHARKRKRR